MKRAICLFVLVSVLGFANRAWAGAPAGAASPVFFVQFNVSVGPSLPAGSIILCKAELVPGSNELDRATSRRWPTLHGQVTSATVLRGPATECALEIPFSWTGNAGPDEIAMHYEIDAIGHPGALPVVLAEGVRTGIRIAGPPAASFVRLGFNGVR
ncbi:MAG TPA: hypothetical protein VMR02_08875 [Terracidiphilus sp.]|jgi:hypothetical protein|nr:hypothetical protein [Terracidiphilus sp.]